MNKTFIFYHLIFFLGFQIILNLGLLCDSLWIQYEKIIFINERQMKENKLLILKKSAILIVDDDEQILHNLKLTLSIFFDTVLTAKNGIEALKIYEEVSSIDVIITDYVMPKMCGYVLCKKIRRIDNDIPIIMMSNYSEKEKLLKSIPLGLIDYLIKPIEYTTLSTALLKIAIKINSKSLDSIFLNELEYSFIRKEIKKDNTIIKLTKNEALVLELLINNKTNITSVDQIKYTLDAEHNKSEQAIKNLFYRLRLKIGKNMIINNKALGYSLLCT